MNAQQLILGRLPEIAQNLSADKLERIVDTIAYLYSQDDVLGVMLGGSLTYKDDIEQSDVDLFCLFQDTTNHTEIADKISASLKETDVVLYQGYFLWTQQLYTVYYKNHLDFGIDFCLIDLRSAPLFFWEPTGTVLFDKRNQILEFRERQRQDPHFPKHPFLKPNPFSLATLTLKKIEKNLNRNHLWNALEVLTICRRYLMQIVRCYVLPEHLFIGRVDRDIEDILPASFDSQFRETVASYNAVDIARKAIRLIDMLRTLIPLLTETNEDHLRPWILGQLDHEQSKLLTYLAHAQA